MTQMMDVGIQQFWGLWDSGPGTLRDPLNFKPFQSFSQHFRISESEFQISVPWVMGETIYSLRRGIPKSRIPDSRMSF